MVKQISPEGLKWFQDARFGMFIHWGLYSLLGRGEWVMHNERIPVKEYELLAGQFNPVNFNAAEWVSLAADAGQRYIVITSRQWSVLFGRAPWKVHPPWKLTSPRE